MVVASTRRSPSGGTQRLCAGRPGDRICVARPLDPRARGVNTRLMRFIGLLSYGLYLTHRTALMLAARCIPSNQALQVALAFALSMAFCYALHVLVEAPAGRFRKRLISRRSTRVIHRTVLAPVPIHPNVAVG